MNKEAWVLDCDEDYSGDDPPLVWAKAPPSDEYYRFPAFDEYADAGDVPSKVLLEHGWCIPTPCCGVITMDYLEDEGLPLGGVIGTLNTETFCSDACRERVRRNREQCRSVEDAAVQKAKRDLYVLLNRSVTITRTNAYARGTPPEIQSVSVFFTFPGQEIGQCEFRDGKIYVPQGELENYMEWAR